MTDGLRAGVARTDITPPVGIAHAGWGAQTHERAAGVDLPLWATALALSNGEQTTVTLDIDLVYIWERDAAEIRDRISDLTGVPESNVRLMYTHTHSGPTMRRREGWIEEGSEMQGPYMDFLVHELAGAAWEAVNDLQPVRIAAGTGRSEIAVNRRFKRPEDDRVIVGRNPDGPVDHEVEVMRLDTEEGDPLAVVANYACHPITVGPDNDLITPDYPGVMKRVVEEATGATCLFLQGAAGDVGPIHGGAQYGIDEYKPLGRRLGHEVARVWGALDPTDREERYVETLESGAPLAVYEYDYPDRPDLALRSTTTELRLPLKEFRPVEELCAEFDEHTSRLQELRENDAPDEEIKQKTMESKRTSIRMNLAERYEGQTHAEWELQVFAIGDEFATVAMPGEPFVEIGMEIKAESPFEHTMFSGYSNLQHAYIPTPEEYDDNGYEVNTTPFTPDAAGVIVDEALATLEELYAEE